MDLTLLFTIIAVIVAALIGVTQVKKRAIRIVLIIVIIFSIGTIAVLGYQALHVDDWIKKLNTEEKQPIKVADEWFTTSTVSRDGSTWGETITAKAGDTLYFRITYHCLRDFQNDVVFYETLVNEKSSGDATFSFVDNYYFVMDKDVMRKVEGTLDSGYHADTVQGDSIFVFYRLKVEGSGVVYNAARTVTASGTQYDQCKITVE